MGSKLVRLIACAISVCFVVLSFPVLAEARNISDLGDPEVAEAFVDDLVYPLMKNDYWPSGVFSIAKDGELILSKGNGYQNIEKRILVDPAKTLFRSDLISRLFTKVSMMPIEEQGKLDLDVGVIVYFRTVQIKDSNPNQPFTNCNIMTHTTRFEELN